MSGVRPEVNLDRWARNRSCQPLYPMLRAYYSNNKHSNNDDEDDKIGRIC